MMVVVVFKKKIIIGGAPKKMESVSINHVIKKNKLYIFKLREAHASYKVANLVSGVVASLRLKKCRVYFLLTWYECIPPSKNK